MGMETERPCSREVSGQKMSVWDAAKGKIPFKRQSVAKYLQGSVKGSLPLKEKQKILLQDKSSPLSSPGPCLVRRPRAAGAPKGTLGTGQATELTLPGRCTPHCSVRRINKHNNNNKNRNKQHKAWLGNSPRAEGQSCCQRKPLPPRGSRPAAPHLVHVHGFTAGVQPARWRGCCICWLLCFGAALQKEGKTPG